MIPWARANLQNLPHRKATRPRHQDAKPSNQNWTRFRSKASLLTRQLAWILVSSCVYTGATAQQAAILSHEDIFHPVVGSQGMVASQDEHASRIGIAMLRAGGNAIDAAVAIGFSLAVTLPRAGNLGGGGFMLIHLGNTGETIALDYRETAPHLATRDMYLDAAGEADAKKSRFSYQSVGVPGTVAGLAMALDRYGSKSLAEVLAPAIELAENGFLISQDLAASLASRSERFAQHPASAAIFLKGNGENYQAGELLRQPDLAWSLRQIANHGHSAFYTGAIGKRLVDAMIAHDGLIRADDLRDYRAVIRTPIHGSYRGYQIRSMPPPSSGGVHLVQILNLLESYPITFLGHNSADTIHLMAEAMKLAYADRSEHLGDSDFWPVPVRGLTSKSYAESLRPGINIANTRPATDILPGKPQAYESNETTHFSVMDAHGNAVSNTYTINFSYGSGIVAAGTGILLNNEMDDFSAKSGVPNAYGLIGGAANAIEPGKRPLSSMTPTIVLKDGQAYLATGSPGGSRIITTTLQIIMNVIDHGMNIAAATAATRIHHQWLPDELRVERGLSPDTLDLLAGRGHSIVTKSAMGSTQSIMRTKDGFLGSSDPRKPGALTLGY